MRLPIDDVLDSSLSIAGITLDERQRNAVQAAMYNYSARTVENFEREQNKAAVKEALRLFPALFKGQIMLYLRKKAFEKTKKQAQIEADIDGRPYYVIRSGVISYIIQSSREAKALKRRGVYKKNVNSLVLSETADCVCYPSKYSIGDGITSKEIADELKNRGVSGQSVYPPKIK